MKVKSESEVAQSCPTLRDPMDCSLPDSSIHGILQARVLEWGATAFSEVLPYPLPTANLHLKSNTWLLTGPWLRLNAHLWKTMVPDLAIMNQRPP